MKIDGQFDQGRLCHYFRRTIICHGRLCWMGKILFWPRITMRGRKVGLTLTTPHGDHVLAGIFQPVKGHFLLGLCGQSKPANGVAFRGGKVPSQFIYRGFGIDFEGRDQAAHPVLEGG